ncbi:Uncharacterised protein [Porphyromonas macacae]|uniref:Uncharacterized protein n=1 Tax=Porphyromonas macacae TaxID=28115 RepID=A0A379DKJ2_9PORP|nr:Uncharacterised protein [Porphyromonas macacae]
MIAIVLFEESVTYIEFMLWNSVNLLLKAIG